MSLYSEIDLPHRPSSHPLWQESWVLVFRDLVTNCVGFLRTGACVNQGTTQTHWGMALPDGTRFRRHWLDRELEPGDRTEDSASSGSMKVSFPNLEYVRFEGRDADAEADLRLYDFFPSQSWEIVGAPAIRIDLDHRASLEEEHGHPESAGRLEGRVRIGDRAIEIEDGLGYRDHSFGPRVFSGPFRSARWHAGTLGETLSYSLLSSQTGEGVFARMGWIMRSGARLAIEDFHTVNCTLDDGFSTIGGWTHVRLRDGSELRIEVETLDGVVTSTHANNGGPGSSPAGVEALSIPRWNGLEGVCDFNMIDNAHRGERPVSNLFLANCEDGLSRLEHDLAWVR